MAEIRRVELQCKSCKTWFPSPVQCGDTDSFDSSTLFGNVFGCPAGGQFVSCNKENLRQTRSDGKGGWG